MRKLLLFLAIFSTSTLFAQFQYDSLSGSISVAPYSFTGGVVARENFTTHGVGLQTQLYYKKLYIFGHYTVSYSNSVDSEAGKMHKGVVNLDSRLKFQHLNLWAGYNLNPIAEDNKIHQFSLSGVYSRTFNALGRGMFNYINSEDSLTYYQNYRLERHHLMLGINWKKDIEKEKTTVVQNVSFAAGAGFKIYTKAYKIDSTLSFASAGSGEMNVTSPFTASIYYDRAWCFNSGNAFKLFAVAHLLPTIYLPDGDVPRGGTPPHYFFNVGVAWSYFKSKT